MTVDTPTKNKPRRRKRKKVNVDTPVSVPGNQTEFNDPDMNYTSTGAPIPKAPVGQHIAMGLAVVLPFLGVITAIVLLWQFGWMGWPYLAMLIGG